MHGPKQSCWYSLIFLTSLAFLNLFSHGTRLRDRKYGCIPNFQGGSTESLWNLTDHPMNWFIDQGWRSYLSAQLRLCSAFAADSGLHSTPDAWETTFKEGNPVEIAWSSGLEGFYPASFIVNCLGLNVYCNCKLHWSLLFLVFWDRLLPDRSFWAVIYMFVWLSYWEV